MCKLNNSSINYAPPYLHKIVHCIRCNILASSHMQTATHYSYALFFFLHCLIECLALCYLCNCKVIDSAAAPDFWIPTMVFLQSFIRKTLPIFYILHLKLLSVSFSTKLNSFLPFHEKWQRYLANSNLGSDLT